MQDRTAVARVRRRERARETLELERARADELRAELEELRSELDGQQVDLETFKGMDADDVELVREAMGTLRDYDDGNLDGEWSDDEIELGGDEDADSEPDDYEGTLAAEIERLELELASSGRTQLALQRYLDVLGT
ncbi:MAG: hypothetical protein OXG37_04650 [Actinomycetia bacterium]|nr:hypothetical protein [Actinomycetes bacterium]